MNRDIHDVIIENSPIGYCVITPDLEIVYVNQCLLNYLDVGKEKIGGTSWVNLLIEKNFLRNREKVFLRWMKMKFNLSVTGSRMILKIADDIRTEFYIQIDTLKNQPAKLVTIYPVSGTIILQQSRFTAKLSHEYRIASKIQRNLNDYFIEMIEGRYFKYFFSRIFKASGILSGDIINIKNVSRRYSSLFLGDGRGHGLPAALYSSLINSYLNMMSSNVTHGVESPAQLIKDINSLAYRDFSGSGEYYFFSGVYGLIDGNTRDFTVTNAGHPYPLLLRDGKVVRLKSNGALVGILENSEYTEARIQLCDGDIVIVFTDGLYEIFSTNSPDAEDNDGITALVTGFLSKAGNESRHVFGYLKDSVESFCAKHDIQDDITILQMCVEEKPPH